MSDVIRFTNGYLALPDGQVRLSTTGSCSMVAMS
jgi:hypothetical protein